jgi:hypothetical protein
MLETPHLQLVPLTLAQLELALNDLPALLAALAAGAGIGWLVRAV